MVLLLSICCTIQPAPLWKVRRHLRQAFDHVHCLCKCQGNGCNCYETPLGSFFAPLAAKNGSFMVLLLSICCTVQPTLLWKVRRPLWQAFGYVHYLCKYRGNCCKTAMKLRCGPFFAIVGGKNGWFNVLVLSICFTVQPTLLWKLRRHLWQAFGHVYCLCKYRGNGCKTAMKLRCGRFFSLHKLGRSY
jgi:hypothetical protein